MLVVVAGPVASGKSTLSRALATRLGGERLEADRVRGTLLQSSRPDASGGSGAEASWRRDLSGAFEQEIYADLLRRADLALASGRSVVLDGCFPLRTQREGARQVATRHGARFLYVGCRTPEETIRARLAARDRASGHGAWLEIYRRLAEHFEPATELCETERMEVSGDGSIQQAVDAIQARLGESVSPPREPQPGLITPLPRVVSFDCWGTLLAEEDWPWAHRLRVEALMDAAGEAGVEVGREAGARAFDAAWHRHLELWAQGRASGAAEVAAWGLAELGLGEPHPALDHLVRRFEEASHTSHVVALEGARALLGTLEASGVSRVLVCDTGLTPGRVVRRLLDRVGLLAGLEVLAFSDEVGAPKPDPRPFLAALEPLGVAPDEALHVGDLRRTDVAGARGVGMRTVRIRARNDDPGEWPEADHVVDSHAELAGLLGLGPVVA